MEIGKQLNMLIRHQEIVLRLLEISKWISEKPIREKRLEKNLEQKNTDTSAVKENLKNLVSERKRLEGDLELRDGKIEKYKSQIRDVKTNEEYQALLTQIENAKIENSKLEDRILGLYEECDKIESEVGDREKEVVKEEEDLKTALEESAREEKEFLREREGLEEEKERIERELPEETLTLYKKVAIQRNNIAMARAKDYICQECHVRVRPQPYLELQKAEKIITCEGCRRILYHIDETGS